MKYNKIKQNNFVIPKHDKHFKLHPEILKNKYYQGDALRFALKFCSKTEVALDIGAHIGLITAHLYLYFKKIYTFEPCLENFNCLVKNINYKNVVHNKIALSNKIGVLSLNKHKNNSGGHTFKSQLNSKTKERVNTKFLDFYNYSIVNLIKIDVEGWELKVLEGAVELIKRCHPVILIEDVEKNDSKIRIYLENKFNIIYRGRIGKFDTIYSFHNS